MSEKGNLEVVAASPSSQIDSSEKKSASGGGGGDGGGSIDVQSSTKPNAQRKEESSGGGGGGDNERSSPTRKTSSSSTSKQNSDQQPPLSPRKFSQPQPRSQNQQQQFDSPPRRKFSNQYRQYSQPIQPSFAPHPGQQPFQPFNHQQQGQQGQQGQGQFQPSWRKLSNQRQQSLPAFRNYQQPLDQNFVVPTGYGVHQQQQPPQPHRPHPMSMTSGQRRGSSVSVTFQPQQHDQKTYRKSSYQQVRYENNAGGNQQQQQQQASGGQQGPPEYDRRRHSTGNKNRKKSSDASGPSAGAGRTGKTSIAGPRWSSLSESNENGSGEYDYYSDEFEMEEPFSDTDEDETPEDREARRKRQAKPSLLLPMPRRRIRTLSGMIPAVGHAPVWGGPTMCLNCLEFFDLPKQTSEYVQHLLDKHKIVITDIELIVDLKRYIEHWRHRFGQQPIEKTFPTIKPVEGDSLFGKVDDYYLMSEKLPEDRQIRERLALRRLEEVLSCQQREREDRSFSRQCLFCRYRTKGNRAKLVHHLYTIHHLNLGSPDNLVFVSEYLDVLEGKLKRNECIYCEKTFPDHPTLSEHMRKKQHREVNPKNNYYDRFYVINYLELGKKWLEVLAEDFEDNTPTFLDSDEEEEEESWNEWQEDAEDENDTTAVCLFCDEAFEEAPKFLEHTKEAHQYDLKEVFADGHFGFYDRVKFVNYVRKLSHDCICFICGTEDLRSWPALRKHLANPEHLKSPIERSKWDKDEYLIPTYDNDNLLCLLEDILELDEDDFVAYVSRNDKSDEGADMKPAVVHETILEDEEEKEDDLKEEPPKKPTEENGETATKKEEKKQSGGVSSSIVLVIPEDLPEVDKDSALNDPELIEQLK